MKISALTSLKMTAAVLLALGCIFGGGIASRARAASPPSWQSTAVIYCVDPEIFSTNGLQGVDSALPRLQSLGVNVIWLMPFQPIGQAGTYAGQSRPSYQSRYDMSNLEGFGAGMGSSSDLTKLITDAHNDGMHVIMDVALNQTSWDNPLIEAHPEYYYHSDGNFYNVDSIENGFPNGFNDADIAGVDILDDNHGAQTYMKSVMQYWLGFNFDGFRFDSADSPQGSSRDFVQSYAQGLYSSLNSGNSLMWLEEGNNVQLADQPYTLDYDWDLAFYPANYSNSGGNQFVLQNVAKNGSGVSTLESKYTADVGGGSNGFPSGFQHMAMLMDWDSDEDYNLCGGFVQVLDAAAFNLTVGGVPMVYNGEEVGNDVGGDNTHTAIDWSSPNATKFTTFYQTMIGNRKANSALQQGSLTFEPNSNNSNNVATYDRASGSDECYIEINFSGSTQTGTCTVPSGSGSWTDISPSVSPGGTSHTLPGTGSFSLAPYDYAVFKRGAPSTPSTPTGFTATPGNAQVVLSWNASSGATSYNLYRSTTSGGEGTTAIGTTTGTSYTDSGLSNGTKYYYKVAAVNSSGTSPQSGEVSATPSGSAPAGSLTGSVNSVGSATTYNLTTLGTADWAAWGVNSGYDHDSSGGSKISNVTAAGGSLNGFTSSYLGFTWTNGTPDGSETNETNGYYNNAGVGDGFSFTVPAGTTSQNLIVYVGGWTSGGTLTATLSDGSAPAYTNSSLSNSGNSYYGYYTLAFKAASAAQRLTITWKENSGSGNVTIYAAYLTGGVSVPAAPTGLTATPGNAQVSLAWTASSGATSYNVYRSTTSGGEGTTPIGSTASTTYTDSGLANGTKYYYKVAAVNSAGTSAQSSEQSATPSASGSLTGTVTAVTSPATFNLTSQGTTDWAAWGYDGFDHKSSGGGKISNVSAAGGSLNSFTSSYLGFTWTDGTPDASVTGETNGYYNNAGVGDGFSFTVPAGTTSQNMTVYLGGWTSGGTLTATLSDGSAPAYSNSSLSNSGNSYYGFYTLAFKAASASQTMTVTWKQNSGSGNVTIYGATLH